MDCVITAGGVPGPEDPLYPYTKGKTKALLDINGRTMLERVVDALQGSRYVDDIVIVGLGSDLGMQFQRPVHHLPDQGSLIGNAIAGMGWLRGQKPEVGHVLFSSADTPALTTLALDEFIDNCQPLDAYFYYIFVTRQTMEARYPGSRRTFVKLKGAEVAGGDLGIMHADLVESRAELWVALTNSRKHAWKLARVMGIKLLFQYLFRRLGYAELEATAERILGHPVRIVVSPHAEIAMDVDKPYQLELMREHITN